MATFPATLTSARIFELTSQLTGSGPIVTVRAPYTGEVITELPTATAEDVRAAADRARLAQRAWAARPIAQRAEIGIEVARRAMRDADQLLDVIQAETGKSRIHAFDEVLDLGITCRYYGLTAPRLLAPKRRAGAIPMLTKTRELRYPLGLVGMITPWNYPLSLSISDAIPALIAGNAVLARPDTQTVLTALSGRQLALDAGLPADLWPVLVGPGRIVGSAVIDAADHVAFTGSTAAGRAIAAQAGKNLSSISLELGGKNPMIVCADADIKAAVAGAVRGAFASAGQLCVSFERIYVNHAVYDEFAEAFATAVGAIRLGAAYDFSVQMGSLTNTEQLTTVSAHVDDARACGARVLAGGRARPDLGPLFYEPTVLAEVPPEAICYRTETFGPVVSLYPVSSDAEAIERANDTEYGLNAAVWTRSAARGRKLAELIDAGTVNINEGFAASWGSVSAPMGGWKDSGIGGRHGEIGITEYTRSKTIAQQRWWPIGAHGILRGKRYQQAMTYGLRAMRLLPRR